MMGSPASREPFAIHSDRAEQKIVKAVTIDVSATGHRPPTIIICRISVEPETVGAIKHGNMENRRKLTHGILLMLISQSNSRPSGVKLM